MNPDILKTRYAKWPALLRAIETTRQAGIAASIDRNPTTLYYWETAQHVERKLRLALAPAIRAYKEALAYDIEHRRRYTQAYARKSRTIETAEQMRLQRATRRRQARAHAETKRANNRRK